MASRRAVDPSASHAQADGRRVAVGGDELDQAGRRGVGLERDDPTHIERRDAGPDEAHDHLRQVEGGLDEVVDGRCVRDRPPQRERRAALEVHEVGGRDDAERRPVRVDDREVVDAGVEHVDHRVDGQALGRERLRGRDHEPADRRGAGKVLGDELPAQVGVGDDPEPVIELDEDARDVGGGHEARGVRGGGLGRAHRDRPVDERAEMGRALLGLGVRNVAGPDEPLSERARHELHAGRAREHRSARAPTG